MGVLVTSLSPLPHGHTVPLNPFLLQHRTRRTPSNSNFPPCLLLLRLEAQSAKAASLADAARSRVADLERRAAGAKRLIAAAAAARGDAVRLLALRRAQQQAAAQKAQLER